MTAAESPTVWINPFRRILKQTGAVCGGIRTGSDKIRSGYGNGDCLYFDFENLVFAVADGSERFPWASRDLLRRLSECLAPCGAPDTVNGWLDLMNEKVYAGQSYQHKTTFSCVAVRGRGEDTRLIISHGGDSAVRVLNGADGSIRRQTGRDMNFAGRSRAIADVTEYPVAGPDDRVLISTDGFDDLWRFCRRRAGIGGAAEALRKYPLDGICERIFGILEENAGGFEYDDVGLILLDPNRLGRIGETAVVMGGTRPAEERRYLGECKAGSHDRWVPDRLWGDQERAFAGAGIRVLIRGF